MDQDERLNIIKNILLTDERELSAIIQERLNKLESQLQDNALEQQVDPFINSRIQTFKEDIPNGLGPAIVNAIKTEIKNSKDEVVEALYPILGKMVKRYVQNEIRVLSENINKQISKRFSLKGLFNIFKSKVKGEDIGDLIIQDQFKPIIEQIMVIEKGSGLIVSEYSITNNIDNHVVAGMLTAIKSFAEDAFNKNNQDLESIAYESYNLHIQNFSSYYIAAAISGNYNTKFKNLLEDKLLDFAQNVINKEDVNNKASLTKKLKSYFKDNESVS